MMILKGKHWFLFLIAAVAVSCSPKVVKTNAPVKEQPKEAAKPEKPTKKFTEAALSVLIPFKLNQLNLKTATQAQLAKTDMAVDFYQGVMMGIDSAAKDGLNFKVNVFDTRDDNAQLASVLRKESVKNSNLIIGPVFPEGLKYATNFSIANNLPIVSPLAASKASEFNNPQLISIVNSIDQHAVSLAQYIGKKFQSSNAIVVLINTKSSSALQLAAPLKKTLQTEYPKLQLQEFSSTYAFETKMIKGKKYAVVICTDDSKFVAPSILKLYRLKSVSGYDINLFAHPNWIKQTYNIDQLEALSTIISTSYHVDYKSSSINQFIKDYRIRYNFEPTEYAFKGFDIGYYFGKLLAKHGERFLDFLTKEKYDGLHNSFRFDYDPAFGYFNTDLRLLQYKNLMLNVIE